jgi:hypothetical protein
MEGESRTLGRVIGRRLHHDKRLEFVVHCIHARDPRMYAVTMYAVTCHVTLKYQSKETFDNNLENPKQLSTSSNHGFGHIVRILSSIGPQGS